MDPAAVDRIIEKLLEVRLSKPGKLVQLSESEIKQLCVSSRDIFVKQPNLLELEAPIKICVAKLGMRVLVLQLNEPGEILRQQWLYLNPYRV
ncbi:hypothetical protein MTR67_026599 [Solanum verrucosum]|uniref:protein-serine/threonine phosphatase n=1 Tax=Solanum verrucosum TaxID=315347 RepID=A0AAF0R812_SOLVR|nr:hypothetical protein MTR67_026599 [Solanum verrucosum]